MINNINKSLKIIDGKFIISSKKIFMNNINFLYFLFRCDYKKKLKESKPIIKEIIITLKQRKEKKEIKLIHQIICMKIEIINYLFLTKIIIKIINQNQMNAILIKIRKKNIILHQILNSVQINLKEKNEKNKNKKKVLILLQIVTEHQKIYPLIIL